MPYVVDLSGKSGNRGCLWHRLPIRFCEVPSDLEKLHTKITFNTFIQALEQEKRFIWKNFHEEGFQELVTIGVSIFNKDRTLAIVHFSVMSGSLAGYGGYCKYELKNGTWTQTGYS